MTNYRITAMTVGSGNNHIVRENDISFNAGPGVTFGGTGHLIQNNNVSNNGGTAISLGGSGHRFESNTIRSNGGIGVTMTSNASAGNTITRNSITGNGGLGIDLAPTGPNPNDLAANCADGLPDCDTGPNGRQNFPVLDSNSRWTASGISLSGTLPSRPNQIYTLEFFASRAADATGFGEGEVFLGSATVTTDAQGHAAFNVSLPGGNPFGDGTSSGLISATATDASGSTSEFSQALPLSR
jgi:hypothetical protein